MQTQYKDNEAVMQAVKDLVRQTVIFPEMRSTTDKAKTNDYIALRIKTELGFNVAVSVVWDTTLTMAMGRVMMFSPVNGKILNFSANP